jgi:hypothetical protein
MNEDPERNMTPGAWMGMTPYQTCIERSKQFLDGVITAKEWASAVILALTPIYQDVNTEEAAKIASVLAESEE